MSRRKQTKQLHVHGDGEGEEKQDSPNGRVTAKGNAESEQAAPHLNSLTSTSSDAPTVDTPTLTTPDSSTGTRTPTLPTPDSSTGAHPPTTDSVRTGSTGGVSTKRDLRGRKRKMSESADAADQQTSTPSFRDCSFQVNTSDTSPSPRKRNPSLSSTPYETTEELTDYSRSRSSIAAALVLAAESSRRQSSRLQSAASPSRGGGDGSGKRTSHRTCEYCGVIKPTPAALQRHVRKHTGERPFVCQVCQKAYKAKRSLLCHQLTHHPELSDAASMLNGSDLSPAVSPTKQSKKKGGSSQQPTAAQKPSVADSPAVSDGTKSPGDADPEEPPVDCVEDKEGASPLAIENGCPSLQSKESTQDFSANVSTISADGIDMDGDETMIEASRRSCPYCHKEFVKPSDLKRHLMVHTGEKPYICQFCKKGFKQPQSLNYHLKATHKVDIPLSQGLEERYLRLKTRAAMRDLAAMETWTPKAGQEAVPVPTVHTSDLSSSSYAEPRPQPQETETENHHQLLSAIPQSQASCSSFSPDFKHGLLRQTSVASEGSWTEDRALGPNIIEVELPQFPGMDGTVSEDPAGAARKVPMMVKKEAMLLTQLDGTCPFTKQDMQVFRCCLCDKALASMFHAFCHLSNHFEHNQVGLECRACNLAFTSQPEMDDHYQRKHNVCLNDLDLQNNNHKLKGLKNEDRVKHSYSHFNSSGKSFQPIDDHNNNNDDHINKEHTVVCSSATSPEPASSPPQNYGEEGPAGSVEGLDVSEAMKYTGNKGAHRCPKCSKCYMTKFLLDRHVAFHTRQDLIEAAMKSGANVNGAHKDLLLQPPPVVPQDGHRYLQLRELDLALKAQQEEEEEERLAEAQVISSGELVTKPQDRNESGHQDSKEALDTKAVLEEDGIEEDVVVVLPTDPDIDNDNISLEIDLGLEANSSEVCDSDIRIAPKRLWMPEKSEPSRKKHQRIEPSPSKSRRKSSQPTKHRSALRNLSSTLLPLSSPSTLTYPSEEEEQQQEPQQPEPSASSQETEDHSDAQNSSSSPKREIDGESVSPTDAVSESPVENEESSKEGQMEMSQSLNSSLLQNLHSAFSRMPPGLLANLYSNKGLFTPSSLASAAAGYLQPFPHLPGRSFSLHAPASVCNPSSLPQALSPLSPQSGNDDEQVEDVSVSSENMSSPATSVSVSHPAASALTSQSDPLMGYPRVLWDTPSWSRATERSPPLSPLSTSSSSVANGKRVNPMWHSLSSEDLSNASATDGRKVTSLSRTHSRLYVVNQPVDRERLCKPTLLPDGRTVFRCIFCHKDFLSYSDINRHMDFHEDIRPYKCNFCDYYARTNSQLKVHMMRHQGIREYCCCLCKYKGVTQSDLNRHMKSQIHLLKSQNECSKCGEGFVASKTLEKHIATGCKTKKKKEKQDD